MYADRVSSGSKRSVKDRLYGNDYDDDQHDYNDDAAAAAVPTRRNNTNTNKRPRQNDDKWKHDLYDDNDEEEPQISYKNPKAGSRDLRFKLQKKNLGQLNQSAKGLSVRGPQDLREKLSGSMLVQPMNNDVPKSKQVVEVTKHAKNIVPAEVPAPETKKPSNTASRRKSQQKAEPSVDSLLQSLGLEKYSITFQAEEIDMTALMHMNDEDLKALGIPMGPRKKILLALDSRA
ncbi:Sterile alpha motif domain-containing protein isoform [Thalictrum thalictroides]|uniref:Sterile alpha motif domain-containing protein isoform n=1 Tax=Thalictrum thalictroides TaxID=46969 RepID=A0A7J6X2U9_THATH|nr:Sterile alpha motif domain-containing protein isoform [Thalictrum thalictroides]